ncbi:site-specific DNA-methyltransferase [Anabaena cylindrica UHCC 0172]|uniref:site-specific DNA-methyltransferase n=1 Tax=Anabaena cylindrica TaxID=1165 RepID=UPI002B217724|nr:site-specific DNA-methyltransferase [Anabaena cylindrica]MEA5553279.1 site-specific DNA-methyltransferase [Anabaena cylindrica UHCC 0172]
MTNQPELNLNLTDTKKIDSIEDYEFEPIKGYPMLRWQGKRPFTSTVYYPAQLKERHANEVDNWINKIFWGDNLQVMSHLLKEFRGKVKLVYIDPPFDSKADYKKKISLKGKQVNNDQTAFEEKQYTDIWNNDEYLQFMYERLILIRELLAEDGSIYVHCDSHKSHYLRIILDEIFGLDNFQNEIAWKRTTARSDQKTYNHIHDVILFYTKSLNNFIWNRLFTSYDKEKVAKQYRTEEITGRLYQAITLIVPGIRNGSSGKPWRNIDPSIQGNHWKYPIEKLEKLDSEGYIYWPSKGNVPRLKQYLDKMPGMPIQSIWDDILLSSNSSERLNYPTQKPEALLERIIQASSNPGDIVFDCFMGSGTTQAVAMKLGRRFIGADINLGAVQITTKRLLAIASEINQENQQQKLEVTEEESLTKYTGIEVYNVNHYDVFRNPIEAKELLLEALEIQKLEQGSLFDGEKDGRMIKIMPVNRIATRTDLNELIAGFDYKAFEKRLKDAPNKPVEKITLICMGHEANLGDLLQKEVFPYKIDVEVVDILRDRQDIQFKRDSEAKITVNGKYLVIEKFYPMNLLQKLSMEQETVEDWRELVESIMIDWNYDGAILEPALIDIPEKNELVKGRYEIPADAGTIRVKITDLLSESLEVEVQNA